MALRLGIPADPDDGQGAAQPADQRATRPATAAGSGCSGCRPTATGPTCCGPSSGPSGPTTSASPTIESRWQNSAELVAELNEVFATKPLDGVGRDLRPRGRVVGAGAARPRGRSTTRRRHAAGGFVDVPDADGRRAGVDGRHARSTSTARRGRRAPCRPSSRSTPRRCCSSSATTGTGSSSSRTPAPSRTTANPCDRHGARFRAWLSVTTSPKRSPRIVPTVCCPAGRRFAASGCSGSG